MQHGDGSAASRHFANHGFSSRGRALRLTVAGVALCLLLSLPAVADVLTARPFEELTLMTDSELATELATSCRVMHGILQTDPEGYLRAGRYGDRILLVLRHRHHPNLLPAWAMDLGMASVGQDIDACNVPLP